MSKDWLHTGVFPVYKVSAKFSLNVGGCIQDIDLTCSVTITKEASKQEHSEEENTFIKRVQYFLSKKENLQ